MYVPDGIAERRRKDKISHTAFQIFIVYCEHAHHETGICFPTTQTVAAKLGVRADNLKKPEKELVTKGWVTIVEFQGFEAKQLSAGWLSRSERKKRSESSRKASKSDSLKFSEIPQNLVNMPKVQGICLNDSEETLKFSEIPQSLGVEIGENPRDAKSDSLKFSENSLNFRVAYKEVTNPINQQEETISQSRNSTDSLNAKSGEQQLENNFDSFGASEIKSSLPSALAFLGESVSGSESQNDEQRKSSPPLSEPSSNVGTQTNKVDDAHNTDSLDETVVRQAERSKIQTKSSKSKSDENKESPQTKLKKSKAPSDERRHHPAIVAFLKAASRYPPKDLWDTVIAKIGDAPDENFIASCYVLWRSVNGSPLNLEKWLFEPARTGKPPELYGKNESTSNQQETRQYAQNYGTNQKPSRPTSGTNNYASFADQSNNDDGFTGGERTERDDSPNSHLKPKRIIGSRI